MQSLQTMFAWTMWLGDSSDASEMSGHLLLACHVGRREGKLPEVTLIQIDDDSCRLIRNRNRQRQHSESEKEAIQAPSATDRLK